MLLCHGRFLVSSTQYHHPHHRHHHRILALRRTIADGSPPPLPRCHRQLVAPVLPHMAEDIWLNLPYPSPSTSVFENGWPEASHPPHQVDSWMRLIDLRDDVNKALEEARRDKLIGSSLQAEVVLYAKDAAMEELLQRYLGDPDLRYPPERTNAIDDLRFIFITSKVSRSSLWEVSAMEERQEATSEGREEEG